MRRLLTCLVGVGVCAGTSFGNELLLNGGAEAGDLSGWTLDSSQAPNGDQVFGAVMVGRTGFTPAEGNYFFIFDGVSSGAPPNSEIVISMSQERPVPNGASSLGLSAFVGSEGAPSCDPGRILVTFSDIDGTPVPGGHDTGWILSATWIPIEQEIAVPDGAVLFRVDLLGRLDCGSFIDTFFDSVSVTAGCGGDIDGSGTVDTIDLLQLLGSWGACGQCVADLNCDGTVDTLDLLSLLGMWGVCV